MQQSSFHFCEVINPGTILNLVNILKVFSTMLENLGKSRGNAAYWMKICGVQFVPFVFTLLVSGLKFPTFILCIDKHGLIRGIDAY